MFTRQRSNRVDLDHELRLSQPPDLDRRAGRHGVLEEFHADVDVLEIFIDIRHISIGANQIGQARAGALQRV